MPFLDLKACGLNKTWPESQEGLLTNGNLELVLAYNRLVVFTRAISDQYRSVSSMFKDKRRDPA